MAENTPVQILDIETMTSKLAREIARNIIPFSEICARYHISEDDFERLIKSDFFKVRLEEEVDLWNASTPKAISERVQAKTLTMVEESLPEVFDLIHDKRQPMSAKIEALKWAANVSGLVKKEPVMGSTPSDRVKFNIFIGDQKVSFEKPIEEPKTIEGTADVTRTT